MKKYGLTLFTVGFVVYAQAQVQTAPVPVDGSEGVKVGGSSVLQQPKSQRALLEIAGNRWQLESDDSYSKSTSENLSARVQYGLSDSLSIGVGSTVGKTKYTYNNKYWHSESETSGVSDPTLFGQYRKSSNNMTIIGGLGSTISVGNGYCSRDGKYCNRLDGGSSLTAGMGLERGSAIITGATLSLTARDLRRTDREGRGHQTATGGNFVSASVYAEKSFNKFKLGTQLYYQHRGTGQYTVHDHGTYSGSSSYYDSGILSVWSIHQLSQNFEVKPSVDYSRPLGTGQDGDSDRFVLGLAGTIGI